MIATVLTVVATVLLSCGAVMEFRFAVWRWRQERRRCVLLIPPVLMAVGAVCIIIAQFV